MKTKYCWWEIIEAWTASKWVDKYSTKCHKSWDLIDYKQPEVDFEFCPFCGKRIKINK